jgi:hypothetical protein
VALGRKVAHFEPLEKQPMGVIQTMLAVCDLGMAISARIDLEVYRPGR